MSIKSANKPQAPELLSPTTAETAPITSSMSSGHGSSSTTSTLSAPSSSLPSVGAVCASVSTASMHNVLVYVGNDNYAHAYTVNTPPPPQLVTASSAATATGPYQLQQHHNQSPGAGTGGGGTAKFYPSNSTYLQHVNGYKPLAITDQNNLVRYLVATTDASTDNKNIYTNQIVLHGANNAVNPVCDSAKSESAQSPCSSINSPADQQLLMGVDSHQGNNISNGSNGAVVTSSGSVVPVFATTVAPPVHAQPPPGTSVGVGGNVSTGTALVPALASCVVSGNVITIPYGWKRLISNGAVAYVSPSNIVLTSSDQAKDYLQTAGTCKCGLECPFHFESTFNFDLKVIGKPSLLTPDINIDLTKLCNHKRKLQTLASLETKMIESVDIENDYAGQRKKPKVNNKLVTVTTATSTMPPYNSPVGTTTATTTSDGSTGVTNNNGSVPLHPLDTNLCSTSGGSSSVGGPQFTQQQHWASHQQSTNPVAAQKLPSTTSQSLFSNNMIPQPYYRYPQPSALSQQQPQHQILQRQSTEMLHRYPSQQLPLPPGGFMATTASTKSNTSGDLASQLQISGVATTISNTYSSGVPALPDPNQMVPCALESGNNGNGGIGCQNGNLLGNQHFNGQPTVEQSGPGRPSIPSSNLPHPTAQPNNIRLPHPVCYDPSVVKQQPQIAGIRLPVPYPNAVHQHLNGMRLPKQPWNNGAIGAGTMRCPPPLHNGNIYERVPPLPQHLTASGAVPSVWSEEVTTGRKKPVGRSNPNRVPKKSRPNYHLLTDSQQQQPCPNVDVRQMAAQALQQQQHHQQHNVVQQHGFSTAGGLENSVTNSMITTASPSFIDDPSGYLAQQTALLNSTISGQGLQMNGFQCNTPPPLIQPDHLRPNSTTTAPTVKPPPAYQQHHRTTSKQQQQHFSGGQVYVTQQQQQQLQQQQQHQQQQHQHQAQQMHQVVVNGGVVTSESQQNLIGNNIQGRCTDCLIGGQEQLSVQSLQQHSQMVGNKRSYSRASRGEKSGIPSSIVNNEDPVTSSTFFEHPLTNTPTCTSTSSSKITTNSTSRNSGSRPHSRQLPSSHSVSSPDNRPIQGGTISTSNVSPHHDTSSNSSTCSSIANINGVASPPQQQQQIVLSKVATSQQGLLNGVTPRLCVTTIASNMANLASGVRTLQTQALPIITSPTITLTSRPGVTQQLPQQFHLTTSPQQQQQQLVALATAVTSGNVCNGTTAVVVSSGANGTLVAKSPLEMVQSVVIKSSPPNQHTTNALPPGHILVSSGGQLLMASTSAPNQQQQATHHHLMAPPPPKQQLAMPPISVSPMVTNVTASVTQVIPTVAQQILGQQTVLVNALPTPSFVLQPGVTMTMDSLANLQSLQQIPHLLSANNLLQHQTNQAAAAALLSPSHDIFSALAKSNNGATSPGSAFASTAAIAKKGKKRKNIGGPVVTSSPNGPLSNVTNGLMAQPVTSMLHIAAAANGNAGVVSPQNFAQQLQMHSPQTPVMQALTIVPGKAGGPPQLVMNASPAQATTQHINLLQPVNLLNNATGVHIQNYPTIQQFILPNLGGMVVNADGTATILPATATTSTSQGAGDVSHHAHAQPLQMQLQLQNVNGQNVLTPVATHPGGHISFGSPPTSNPTGLSMLIRPAVSKQTTHHTSPVLQHSPAATAQFLSPNGAATGHAAAGQQFVVNGTTFTSGQLSPLVTAAGISPRAAGAPNGGEYGQTTLMVPCTPVSSNGGNTYVHQNTTIVQQQTTMVTNNGQPQQTTVQRAGNNQINLRPAPPNQQQTTTLNVNLNEQNQFIISDKSLILQTQAQLQHHHQQQQQMQQARQQMNINRAVNLISQANAAAAQTQQYMQSVSTQTSTGLQQVPTTATTSNTFCQTSNALASSLTTASIVSGGTPQSALTPPTPGSPPDTTTLSPLAPQAISHIPSGEAGQMIGETTILVSSAIGSGFANNNSLSIGGGQSPMAGADTTTYSTSSGHSTDDGLSPAPSNCSSVGAGSSGSYAVTSGSNHNASLLTVDSALNILNRVNGTNSGSGQQQQQHGSMAMVHCVSSSEPDATEFTLIDQLDWTKNSFTIQNQNINQYKQRNTKKNQKNANTSTLLTENTALKYEMENKINDGRRSYQNSNLSKSSMDLLQFGNQQQQNQRQTTTLNYPESASTVQYVTGNNSNDATEAIIVQGNYNETSHRNNKHSNHTASTVVLDHMGGSYANNIVEELLKQQQLEALQSNHQKSQDPLLNKNNTRSKYEKLHQQQEQRRKLQKQQEINNIRQTIAALFDDDDSINEVSTTKDTIQSAIDSVLCEETTELEDSEPDSKVGTIPTRSFAVGDLVWAPAHGCPAWPGQVIATVDTDSGKQLPAGHMLIRWFGDSGIATTSSVAADNLSTLTQGLELHHLARKRARTSRKLNSQLEKAIQQAMIELDKISDNKTIQECSANLPVAVGSPTKDKKNIEKSKKCGFRVGTNKDMTPVKKSSSRLRSQR